LFEAATEAKVSSSIRIAEIEAYAEDVFGSLEIARRWMHQNNIALGRTPISMLDTETGAAEVMKILESIAKGGVV
jgi:putative toxin-antitoxin system antitoxin component (TIGR02293 family)